MQFIKYCGFTREEDIRFAMNLPIQAIGYIFHKPSKRYITPEKAKGFSKMLQESAIEKIGIFVDTPAEEIRRTIEIAQLDRIQLYKPLLMDTLFGEIPILKAYQIREAKELEKIEEPQGEDLLLLDSFHPEQKGGTGHTFDWTILKEFRHLPKTIIAGGIREENIETLLSEFQPMGIDLSSGIEIAPGIKSPQKMKTFIQKIKEVIQ